MFVLDYYLKFKLKNIMKNKLNGLLKWGGMIGLAFAPVLSFAQNIVAVNDQCSELNGLQYGLCQVSLILNTVVPMLITLGVIYFIYGVISYAIAKDDEAKTTGRGAMINGLIALLVITSIWGLVSIIKNTFGLNQPGDVISVPCIESPGVDCPGN